MLPLSDDAGTLPARNRRDHCRELCGVALLRASAPAVVGLPRVVLSVHRQRLVSWAGAVGSQLDYGDVLARKLGPHLRYLAFYFAGGFVATITQTLMTLAFGTEAAARVPNLGASGAIAAVLGAYFILYPRSTVFGLLVIVPVRVSAWFFLGFWFLYQLFEANFGLFRASANGGGTAFFAHVGGFVFGVLVVRLLLRLGRVSPEGAATPLRSPI
jgi:hypothetical protein